jgi:type I restriction enzyme R subunit
MEVGFCYFSWDSSTLILDFVHTKLDLYKKLSDPKVNTMFKNKWFEGFYRENVAGKHQPRA